MYVSCKFMNVAYNLKLNNLSCLLISNYKIIRYTRLLLFIMDSCHFQCCNKDLCVTCQSKIETLTKLTINIIVAI